MDGNRVPDLGKVIMVFFFRMSTHFPVSKSETLEGRSLVGLQVVLTSSKSI